MGECGSSVGKCPILRGVCTGYRLWLPLGIHGTLILDQLGLDSVRSYQHILMHDSRFGFLIAFWSWYAFPPLLSVTISKDLHMTTTDVLNSNIVALVATLLVRLVAGPACDKFGPRYTFCGCLLIGAIPTFLAGTAYSVGQLMTVRFFVGILGGSFVPCQVWSTGFFDKNIVGTSNAFVAGFGNAGGGITYFLMPVIFDSLVHQQGLTPHVAWRVTFVVPGICITVVAIAMLLLCDDTPTGKWSERHLAVQQNLSAHGINQTIVDAPTGVMAPKISDTASNSGTSTPPEKEPVQEKALEAGERRPSKYADHEAQMSEQSMVETAQGEVVQKPTFKEMARIFITPQVLVCAAGYFNSFGAELAVNSILGKYYLHQFPKLGQTSSGRWAAMFGLLNVSVYPPTNYSSHHTNSLPGCHPSHWRSSG
ncbi:Nitrate/nitrite transporter NrtP [subsurface metagenome]